MRTLLAWVVLILVFGSLTWLSGYLLAAWPLWSDVCRYALLAVFLLAGSRLGLMRRNTQRGQR